MSEQPREGLGSSLALQNCGGAGRAVAAGDCLSSWLGGWGWGRETCSGKNYHESKAKSLLQTLSLRPHPPRAETSSGQRSQKGDPELLLLPHLPFPLPAFALPSGRKPLHTPRAISAGYPHPPPHCPPRGPGRDTQSLVTTGAGRLGPLCPQGGPFLRAVFSLGGPCRTQATPFLEATASKRGTPLWPLHMRITLLWASPLPPLPQGCPNFLFPSCSFLSVQENPRSVG